MTHYIILVYKLGVVKKVRGKYKFKDHYRFWEYIDYKAIKFLFSFIIGNGRYICYFTCNSYCTLLLTRQIISYQHFSISIDKKKKKNECLIIKISQIIIPIL